MDNIQFLGYIKQKKIEILCREDIVLSVEKINNPTYETKKEVKVYELANERVFENIYTTIEIPHITSTIHTEHKNIVIKNDTNISAGWHIRTVAILIDNQYYECGSKYIENNLILEGFKKPIDVLKNNFDVSNIMDNGMELKNSGTDEFGRVHFQILVPQFGTYPEDYPIRRCNIGLFLIWFILIVYLCLYFMYFKSVEFKNFKFLSNLKQTLIGYTPILLFLTIFIKRKRKKYEKSKQVKVEQKKNEEKNKLYAGTNHDISESFEQAFSSIIEPATNIFNNFMYT